jgi:hypothetical protein
MNKIRTLLCLSILLIFFNSSYPQNKVIGTINNGGVKQTNSTYLISGNLGQTSIVKGTGTNYRMNGGFWELFSEKTINYPTTIQISHLYSFGDPAKTTSYRIIGIPGVNNVNLSNFMTGSPGKQADWLAFWDIGSGTYTEYTGGNTTFNFKPGRAFWVISKNQVNISIPNVTPVTLSPDYSFSIPLHSEWNLISNPFEKNISWQTVKTVNPGVTQPIHYFDGNPGYTQPANFETYKGYYFYNTGNLTALKIPYISQEPLEKGSTILSKELNIKLIAENAGDEVVLGISENSEPGLDELDIFSPPSDFSEVSLKAYNVYLETNYKFLQKDIRGKISEGLEYELHAMNNTGQPLSISANGTDNFSEYEVCLLDYNLMKFYDLKLQNTISLNSKPAFQRYTIFIGTESYIRQKKSLYMPNEYSLYQNYPNPFNPSTAIRFNIPEQGSVSLSVYNVLGQSVTELLSDQLHEPGYYEVEFNAKSISSGIYVYRLRVRTSEGIKFDRSQKMLLIK